MRFFDAKLCFATPLFSKVYSILFNFNLYSIILKVNLLLFFIKYFPKINFQAAALSHYNLINNAIAFTANLNGLLPVVNEDSSFLNVLPLYHVFSFVGGSLIGAYKSVPILFPAPGFNSAAAIKACEDRKCTVLMGTPTMFTGEILERF